VGQVEIDGLVELYAAGQRALALRDGGNGLSEMIRNTCAAIERRLADLGIVPDPALSTAQQPKGRPSTLDISPPG
jgi:Fe2+ transport system protein FeoA